MSEDSDSAEVVSGHAIASSGGITQLRRVIDMAKSGHSAEGIAAWADKEVERLARKAPSRAIAGRERRGGGKSESPSQAERFFSEHPDDDYWYYSPTLRVPNPKRKHELMKNPLPFDPPARGVDS